MPNIYLNYRLERFYRPFSIDKSLQKYLIYFFYLFSCAFVYSFKKFLKDNKKSLKRKHFKKILICWSHRWWHLIFHIFRLVCFCKKKCIHYMNTLCIPVCIYTMCTPVHMFSVHVMIFYRVFLNFRHWIRTMYPQISTKCFLCT